MVARMFSRYGFALEDINMHENKMVVAACSFTSVEGSSSSKNTVGTRVGADVGKISKISTESAEISGQPQCCCIAVVKSPEVT